MGKIALQMGKARMFYFGAIQAPNAQQHVVTQCNTLKGQISFAIRAPNALRQIARTATKCTALQHIVTHCSKL